MNGRYRVIEEVSFNLLGTFDWRGQAIDYVAALLSVNDDDYFDEVTIASDAGPLLFGDSLRDALRRREAARERASSRRSNAGYNHDVQPVEVLATKDHRH